MLTRVVVPVPVSDLDAALATQRDRLGFALGVDCRPTESFRVVQLPPLGSSFSSSWISL